MTNAFFVSSRHMWAKAIAVFVLDRAVWMHGYRDREFLQSHRVIKVPLSVQKLLNADHRVIGDLLLRVQLCFKYHVFVIAIAHNRNRTLEKCVDVNAKSVAGPACQLFAHARPFIWRSIFLMMER